MPEVFTKRNGLGFDGPLFELLGDLEQKTTIGEPGNTSPLVMVVVSDGTTDPATGARRVSAFAAFDAGVQEGIDAIQQVI